MSPTPCTARPSSGRSPLALLLAGLALLATVAPLLGAAPPFLFLEDSSWSFPVATSKITAKASGLGKFTGVAEGPLSVVFLPGDGFAVTLDGSLLLTGTYLRKKPTSTRLLLTLDAVSVLELEERYEDALAASLASQGYPLAVDLALTKQKIAVKVAGKAKLGTAQARFKSRFKFAATASGLGLDAVPAKISVRLSGKSDPVDLATLMP